MKKNLFALFILFLMIGSGTAQITYNSTEFAAAKDSFLITNGSGTFSGISFDTTGANIIWDYNTLPMTTQKYIQYMGNSYPLYKSTYVASCIASCVALGGTTPGCTNTCNSSWNNGINLSRPTLDSINLNGLQVTNGVDLLMKSSSALSQNLQAFTLNVSGIEVPLMIEYNSTDSIYHFPLQYTNADSSSYSYSIDLSDLGIPIAYLSSKKRTNHVEGWGKLITPYKTFDNTLKLRTVIHRSDTIIVDTIKIGQGVLQTVSYSWFATGYKIPVLTASGTILNGIEQITSVAFLDTTRCLAPQAAFVYSPVSLYLSGNDSVEVHFSNQSLNSSTFNWNFDDAGSGSKNNSTLQNPSHYFNTSGSFLVELIACSSPNCPQQDCDTIKIPVVIIDSTKIMADFKFIPINPCAGDTVRFANLSINAVTYSWDFGDNGTSSLKNPLHKYTTGGTYTVTLISKKTTQEDTIQKQIVIHGAPTVDAGINTSITYGDTTQLMASSTSATPVYTWSPVGSLSCISCANPMASPKTTTTYTVTVYDGCGKSTDEITVTVTGGPTGFANNNKDLNFYVYPNPSNGVFYIELNTTKNEVFQISVINTLGEEVLPAVIKNSNNPVTINVNELAAGIYFVKLTGSTGTQLQKITLVK